MIIPLRSDTYREYHPIVTIIFITLNIIAWFHLNHNLSETELLKSSFLLWRGTGLHPLQWLLSSFAHLDFMHLLGNIIFLYAFGMIVEGQIGHLSFTLAYLGIGIFVNIIEQTLLLGIQPSISLGASSAIFGLMAMALIWNPKNIIEVIVFLYIRPFYFEVRVITFCALYFSIDIIFMFLTPFGTSFLHFLGIAVGFVVGLIYLKKGWVDCENLDLFNVYFPKKSKAQKTNKKKINVDDIYQPKVNLTAKINEAINTSDVELAFFLYESNPLFQKKPEIKFEKLITLLFENKMYDNLIFVMKQTEFIQFANKDHCKLLYANVLCNNKDQPNKALNLLESINPSQLDITQKNLYDQTINECKKEPEGSSLELEDF